MTPKRAKVVLGTGASSGIGKVVAARLPAAAEAMRAYAVHPDAVAGAVSYALAQPSAVDVNEVVVRPSRQRRTHPEKT